jgi:hypothetical protein
MVLNCTSKISCGTKNVYSSPSNNEWDGAIGVLAKDLEDGSVDDVDALQVDWREQVEKQRCNCLSGIKVDIVCAIWLSVVFFAFFSVVS